MVDDTDIRRVRSLARALDAAVRVPGTPIRVGLDAVLGLVPGGGDVAGAALSGYIVLAAARRGAPKAVIARMLANVLLDAVVGAIPVLGDLFDVAYKANLRNVALLERYTGQPGAVRQESRWVVAGVVAVVVAIAIGIGVTTWLVARALWQLLSA